MLPSSSSSSFPRHLLTLTLTLTRTARALRGNAPTPTPTRFGQARAAQLQDELSNLAGDSQSPEKARAAASAAAAAAMQEFYDETALREEHHEAALKRIETLEKKLGRAMHVTEVLTRTQAPWTREERQRICNTVVKAHTASTEIMTRLEELEIHGDKLEADLRSASSMGDAVGAGDAGVSRVVEETQLLLLDMKDANKQLEDAIKSTSRCRGPDPLPHRMRVPLTRDAALEVP